MYISIDIFFTSHCPPNPEAIAGCVPETARKARTLPLLHSAALGCLVTSPLCPEGAVASHNNNHESKYHTSITGTGCRSVHSFVEKDVGKSWLPRRKFMF